MASLKHLIGWEWHLQSRVSEHLCQCWGATCCHTHVSCSTDSGGAVFFLRKENSQSHSSESNTYALTFHLMASSWRHQEASGIKINKRDQSAYTSQPPPCLKTLLTLNFTQMSQGPLINLNWYLSALDLSAVSFCNYNPRIQDEREKMANGYAIRASVIQTGSILKDLRWHFAPLFKRQRPSI